jgi:diguanylate cyclase (GGDEF)-like protein
VLVTQGSSHKTGDTLRGDSAQLPSALSPEEYRVLALAGTSRAMLPGEELFRLGDDAQSMYLIDTGEVRLCFDEGLADKLLGPGQYFGELSVFIGRHQRVARAVAETSGVLYEITQPAFDALLAREPAVVARFMQRSFAYLVAGEHQLVQSLRRRNEDLLQTLDSLRQTRSELTVAQQLVRTDDLTGLANRRGLYRYLDEVARHPIPSHCLALLLVDLDHFKRINDSAGHLAGDAALRAIGEEVRRLSGPMDLPCRLGGDEFAIVMRVADSGELANRALGLIESVRALRLPSLRDHRLSISVGGALSADGGDWSHWYSRADMALYEAKKKGGDTWRLAG